MKANRLLNLCLPCLLAGCASYDSEDVAIASSAAVAAPPVIGSLAASSVYNEAKEGGQNLFIDLRLPPDFYAKEITENELSKLVSKTFDYDIIDIKFGAPPDWIYYIGDRGEYHFFAYIYGNILLQEGRRKLYRVKKGKLTISDPFPLKSRTKGRAYPAWNPAADNTRLPVWEDLFAPLFDIEHAGPPFLNPELLEEPHPIDDFQLPLPGLETDDITLPNLDKSDDEEAQLQETQIRAEN